jgi:Leucine-rich repeat (LRR) protein
MQTLRLDSNQIKNTDGLAELTALQYLSIDGNQIADISFLSNLTALQNLYLDNNQITDISSLSKLTQLQSLSIGNNQIMDILPLVNNPGLGKGCTVLGLDSNPLSDLSKSIYMPDLAARGVAFNVTIGGPCM